MIYLIDGILLLTAVSFRIISRCILVLYPMPMAFPSATTNYAGNVEILYYLIAVDTLSKIASTY